MLYVGCSFNGKIIVIGFGGRGPFQFHLTVFKRRIKGGELNRQWISSSCKVSQREKRKGREVCRRVTRDNTSRRRSRGSCNRIKPNRSSIDILYKSKRRGLIYFILSDVING